MDSSFKIQNVLPDAISDSLSQVLSAKDAKMVALIVKELELVLFVKQVDFHTTDCAMLTAQLDQLLKLQI